LRTQVLLAPGTLAALAALAALALAAPAAAETGAETARDVVSAEAAVPAPSVSCGWPNHGSLAGAVALPVEGEGYVVPEPWRERGFLYGTRELVELIERVAARVAREHPGAILGVADLSTERGGAIPFHRSHQSGRDVDLLYYALDPAGDPMAPDGHMAQFAKSGIATSARSPSLAQEIAARSFDAARNWALVAALLGDPEVRVDRIFVSHQVRRWILDHARGAGEAEEIVRAAEVLLGSSRVRGHDDHMHVRIGCGARDASFGDCRDGSLPRPRRVNKFRGGMACPASSPPDEPPPERSEGTGTGP
jgi:penicillin-insensitive murein DD-endopeptidase